VPDENGSTQPSPPDANPAATPPATPPASPAASPPATPAASPPSTPAVSPPPTQAASPPQTQASPPPAADAPAVNIGGATEPTAVAAQVAPSAGGFFWGTGRRKSAVARVRIRPGKGEFLIKKRQIDHYFAEARARNDVVAPLRATDSLDKFDVYVNVEGGGPTGQSQAILLGVARALVKANSTFEPALRDGKFLTRDSREVERKKPGQPGARKRFQFSKR